MVSKSTLQEFLSFSRNIAKTVGKILLNKQRNVTVVKYKDKQDIATTADLASEDFVINAIQKKYPTHNIHSEEKGEINKSSEYIWSIDPLDGTKEYKKNIPLFNFSMSLSHRKKTIVAVVYRPSNKSLYSAAEGLGSFLNGKTISVSPVKKLDESFVYCYLPSYQRNRDLYDSGWNGLSKLGKKVYRIRALADENTALCWLAQGGVEAYVNLSNPPKWHDVAPGLFIASQAGALIFDLKGNKLTYGKPSTFICANSREVAQEILKVVN
jgi:myo-inositol-1(or 4)-monophosphatase